MKKANEIINHILLPFSKKINFHRCLKKIISLLPKNYKKYITSIHYKGTTLYINVSHPALRQEIFFNRHLIFEIVNLMHKNNLCLEINPKKIVTNYKYIPKKEYPQIKFYLKPATGNFKIKTKNEKLTQLFKEIQEIIKANSVRKN